MVRHTTAIRFVERCSRYSSGSRETAIPESADQTAAAQVVCTATRLPDCIITRSADNGEVSGLVDLCGFTENRTHNGSTYG